jgi:murein DD-endopeptidase MepM/ murein hydrolase activator NlpD
MSYKNIFGIVFVCALLFSIMACGAHYKESVRAQGVYHTVHKGETFYTIAKTYNITIQDLAEVNNITDTSAIKVGDVIFIPDAHEVLKVPPTVPLKEPIQESPQTTKKVEITKPEVVEDKIIRFERERFIWPVKGTVTSQFGIQNNGMRFNGIKIVAKDGTPVLASAEGRVIHSSRLKYYGETIIIKHRNNYSTVYAYLKTRNVNVGDTVAQGQTIAQLGKSKSNKQCCLHFEIRIKNKPKNPLFYLPQSKSTRSQKATYSREGNERRTIVLAEKDDAI